MNNVDWEKTTDDLKTSCKIGKPAKKNKTKSLESRKRGELKLKRWMVIKVDWWIKLIDD